MRSTLYDLFTPNRRILQLTSAQSSLAAYSVVIMVISTTGQGDLPANARSFWKSLLRKKLPYDCLQDVLFTTFGLGDSSYPRYNWAARKLHKRLTQLGAVEICSRGEADEQHEEGLDASFVPWSVGLKSHLLSRFPLEGVSPLSEHTLLEPKWLLRLDPSVAITSVENTSNSQIDIILPIDLVNQPKYETRPAHEDSASLAHAVDHRLTVEVQENRRMTPESHWQDVRHLAFTSKTPASYGPGDVLTIYPQNSFEAVNEIISMMGWTNIADELIEFVHKKRRQEDTRHTSPPIAVHGNAKMTLRHLLTNHLDITAIPRRSFFSLIAHFTKDQFQKDRLLEFTDPKYVDELYDYTSRPRRSILEVLQEFESVKIPWEWATHVIPELRGRQFSIASGGRLKKTVDGSARFELLVAIVKYRTVIKKIREGVCTKYLAGLRPGDHLAVRLQRGGLGMTNLDLHAPIIMISPGTGIAPMRSLIWERMQWKEDPSGASLIDQDDTVNHDGITSGSLLFFGCRNESADYFYRDEWDMLQRTGTLQVCPAFSRDQTHKYYVQDAIMKHSSLVYKILHSPNAIIYVCGSSGKMPTAVRAALAGVIREAGSTVEDGRGEKTPVSQEAALKYLEALERDGRYKQETW